MKQVITEPIKEIHTVLIGLTNRNHFYGINFQDGSKGFVDCYAEYGKILKTNPIFFVSNQGTIIQQFKYMQYGETTLQGCLAQVLRLRHEVFEFDSFKELLEWLQK